MPDYDILNEPLVISKSIMDMFLNPQHCELEVGEKAGDCIALYLFYYYTAKWQKTNQPRATVDYIANGLNWSLDRVRKTRRPLLRLGLIKDVQCTKNGGDFGKRYVHVNFIWSRNKNDETAYYTKSVVREKRSTEKAYYAKQEVNALSINNRNALSINNRNALSETANSPSKTVLPNNVKELSKQIILSQIKKYPSRYKRYDQSQLDQMMLEGGKVILQLSRLDKYNFANEIKPAIEYALQDDFWSKVLQSPKSLRKKNKQGNTKFDNIFVQWQEKTGYSSTPKENPYSERLLSLFTNIMPKQYKQDDFVSGIAAIEEWLSRIKHDQWGHTQRYFRSIYRACSVYTEWLSDQDWIDNLSPKVLDPTCKIFSMFIKECEDNIGVPIKTTRRK